MKSIIGLLLILALTMHCSAQKALTPEAQKVKNAYEWLLKQPNLPENQIYFIESFPDTKDHYIETFTPHTFDQLYFDYETYLAKYHELSKIYPKQVMAKSISIGKQLNTADGPASIMQQIIMEIAAINPEAFAAQVNKLKKKEQRALIYFLADVPDPNDYSAYQALVKAMERLYETKIADLMIEVRDEKMKQ